MEIAPDWIAPACLHVATAVQREIASRVETEDRLGEVRLLAGADCSNKWRDARGPIHAAIAPLRMNGAPPPAATATLIPQFAYVSGYLGFREAPALLAAWEKLVEKPDLLLVDGHGRAHPRRCGIASHIGVLLGLPTIGIAKSLLCGSVANEVGPAIGDHAPVIDRGEVVGMALRTSARGGPIYVDIGHRVSLATAMRWALEVSGGRKLPLPIRLAHEAANATRRTYEARLADASNEA